MILKMFPCKQFTYAGNVANYFVTWHSPKKGEQELGYGIILNNLNPDGSYAVSELSHSIHHLPINHDNPTSINPIPIFTSNLSMAGISYYDGVFYDEVRRIKLEFTYDSFIRDIAACINSLDGAFKANADFDYSDKSKILHYRVTDEDFGELTLKGDWIELTQYLEGVFPDWITAIYGHNDPEYGEEIIFENTITGVKRFKKIFTPYSIEKGEAFFSAIYGLNHDILCSGFASVTDSETGHKYFKRSLQSSAAYEEFSDSKLCVDCLSEVWGSELIQTLFLMLLEARKLKARNTHNITV